MATLIDYQKFRASKSDCLIWPIKMLVNTHEFHLVAIHPTYFLQKVKAHIEASSLWRASSSSLIDLHSRHLPKALMHLSWSYLLFLIDGLSKLASFASMEPISCLQPELARRLASLYLEKYNRHLLHYIQSGASLIQAISCLLARWLFIST